MVKINTFVQSFNFFFDEVVGIVKKNDVIFPALSHSILLIKLNILLRSYTRILMQENQSYTDNLVVILPSISVDASF
jgi:hypothetical protein